MVKGLDGYCLIEKEENKGRRRCSDTYFTFEIIKEDRQCAMHMSFNNKN